MRSAAIALLFTACTGAAEPRSAPRPAAQAEPQAPPIATLAPESASGGPICLRGESITRAGAPATMAARVVVAECISECARDVKTSCTVMVDGTTIVLGARATWSPPDSGVVCIESCRKAVADCAVDGLSPGTYTLRSGDHTRTMTWPLMDPPPDIMCP